MNTTFLLLTSFASAMFLTACADLAPAPGRDPRLVGDWACVSGPINGTSLSSETIHALSLVLTDTRYITRKGSETLFDSTYRVDRTKAPAQIFMLGTEGELAGKEAAGIYELTGDTLKICYAMPGDPPPLSFQQIPAKAQLIIWRRRN
jgi:uncharacterized protein (TIGR03067 family)